MRFVAALTLWAVLIVPNIAGGQESAFEEPRRDDIEASSRQILSGVVVDADGSRERRRELGFFRWGFTMELGAAVPIGDNAHTFAHAKEFTSAFDVGFDLSVDVSRFFQASYVMRFGFGGVDRILYSNSIDAVLGFIPKSVRATLIQSGLRVRAFLFEASHFRPYVTLECAYTTMGLTARHDVVVDDDSGDTERVTVLEYRYRAVSVTPGVGLRYDIGLRARAGLPRFSRVLSVYLQASYSFNFWRVLQLDVEESTVGREALSTMELDHFRVTAGVGVMY